MKAYIPSALAAMVGAGALLGLSVPASAYVPPSDFIVKTWSQKHAGPKGVRTRSTVYAMEEDKPSGQKFKLTVIFRAEDGVMRSIATDEQGMVLYQIEEAEPRGIHPLSALLYDSNASRVAASLRKAGVPVLNPKSQHNNSDDSEPSTAEAGNLSLGRIKRQINWVIGKRDGSSDAANQLWVEKDTFQEKDTFRPSKLKIGSTEILFENYRNFREFPFPRVITWNSLGSTVKPILREELADLTLNPSDLTHLSKPITHGFTEAGNSAPEGVRNLIIRYFEKAR